MNSEDKISIYLKEKEKKRKCEDQHFLFLSTEIWNLLLENNLDITLNRNPKNSEYNAVVVKGSVRKNWKGVWANGEKYALLIATNQFYLLRL